jgi:hypothetical protein
LAAGVIAGGSLVDAVRAWQEWHRWVAQDPSQADAYRTFFAVNVTVALLSLAVAALLWWLLRPRSKTTLGSG